MSSQPDPILESGWMEFRRRRRWFWGLFIALFPVLVLIGVPITLFLKTKVPFFILLGGWLTAVAVASYRQSWWKCPRCEETFFQKDGGESMLGRKCMHCGLPKWSTDRSA